MQEQSLTSPATVVGSRPPDSVSHADRPKPDQSGAICLLMLARYHGVAVDHDQLIHDFASADGSLDERQVILAARSRGLHARLVQPRDDRLDRISLPAIVVRKDKTFFLLARFDGEQALVQHPEQSAPQKISLSAFKEEWSGRLILMTSRASLLGELARFDFTWFIPALIKYRRLLTEVLIVSFFIQLLALVTPLFFQVVMDKVLVHRGLTTLDVIAIGLLFVTIFDVLLTGLRSYVFGHTTSRIDVELGAKLFRHLLRLPMSYFQSRRVGDSVARMRELENIRAFLTGNAVTLVLDLLFTVVFIAVMFFYSVKLTCVVLVSLPCYVLLSVLCTPVLRKRLNEKFARGAENQAFLVETISGIDTVKAMAVEPQWTRTWDNQLAAYVKAGFKATTVNIWANGGVGLVNKCVTVVLMWMGARLVIDSQLTVGELIAFNMLSGQVAGPIMRMAQLWTDFQQVGISVSRLGDILNTRTERSGTKAALPPVAGSIVFEGVTFRYTTDGPEILRDLTLSIRSGEVVGIVGQSGSGKSTLTRLAQRLHVPERGRVLVDGQDIALVDAASLRRQLGVVLQESVLFNRSIRDNIALSDPGAPLDSVVRAARLAGAHDFIAKLPEGYETMVGEHGSTLSGGQRQRIAIARALMVMPRILIFDEATSALDYESERIVQNNMREICEGRTVLIIAHRLTTVRHADRIVVMDQGCIVEQGSHSALLGIDGVYARLFRLQTEG